MGGDRVPGPYDDAVDERDRERREFIERHLGGDLRGEKFGETILRARASWLAEFGRLDEIAVDVYNGKRCAYLKKYADAWLHADVHNKRLMKPAWAALIRKYDLEEDPTGTAVSKVRRDP